MLSLRNVRICLQGGMYEEWRDKFGADHERGWRRRHHDDERERIKDWLDGFDLELGAEYKE
ncbi:hypothetical protein YC2023_110688 [Brassica napus]